MTDKEAEIISIIKQAIECTVEIEKLLKGIDEQLALASELIEKSV